MLEDYKFKKHLKCRDCRKRFSSRSRIRWCHKCGSGNIKGRKRVGWWGECVCFLWCLITLPIIIFFAFLGVF